MRRTMVRGLATMGLVNLLAVGMLLSAALPAAQGQSESPLAPPPVGLPLISNPAAEEIPLEETPAPSVRPTRKPKADDEPPTSTAWPIDTNTATPTATETATSTATRTPTPPPRVMLPTLTPDWPATLAAGCP